MGCQPNHLKRDATASLGRTRFGLGACHSRRLRYTSRPVDYVARLKGNVHTQTAYGYRGCARAATPAQCRNAVPCSDYKEVPAILTRRATPLVALLTLVLLLMAPLALACGPATSPTPGDAPGTQDNTPSVAAAPTATATLLLAGRRAPWQFRRRVCSWGASRGCCGWAWSAIRLRRSHRPDGSACPTSVSGYARAQGSVSFQAVLVIRRGRPASPIGWFDICPSFRHQPAPAGIRALLPALATGPFRWTPAGAGATRTA